MTIIRVGVDIAKSVFHVHGADRQGKTCWQGKYSRNKWLDAISKKVPAVFFKLVVIFFALRSLFYFSFFCRVQGHGANGLAVTHRA